MKLKLRLASTLAALFLCGLLCGQSLEANGRSSAMTQIDLKAAVSKHEKEKNWEAYLKASAQLLSNYQVLQDYEAGIVFGENVVKKIKRKSRRLQRSTWPIYSALGLLYESLSEKERALSIYQKQIELLSKYPNDTSNWQLPATYNQIGALYLSQKKLNPALSYLHKAERYLLELQQASDLHGPASNLLVVLIQTYRSLSEAYEQQDEIQKALPYAQLALQTARLRYPENTYPLYPHYTRMGLLYFALEEREKSIEYHLKCIYILKNLPQKTAVEAELAHSYSYLADAMGQDQAIVHYKKSLAFLTDHESHLLLRIKNYRKIGERYNWKDDFVQAWPYIQKADSLWIKNEPTYFADSTFQFARAGIYRSIGHYWKQQWNFDKSLYYYKKYVEVWERYGSGPVTAENISMLMEIAEIYNWGFRESTSYADSSIYYTQKALIKACKTFNTYDQTQLPQLEDLKNITYMYAILKQLARFIEGKATTYGSKEDEKKSLQIALNLMDLADQFHTRSLRQISTLRAGQAEGLIQRSNMIYYASIIFSYRIYKLNPTEELLEKLFYFSQRMKAQKLWLIQLKETANQIGNLPDSIQRKEQHLLADIQQFEKKILHARYDKDSILVDEYLNNQLFEAHRAYESFQVQLERNYPLYLRSKFNFSPTSIAELQQVLAPDELLIEYAISGWEQLAFVVQKDQPPQLAILGKTKSGREIIIKKLEQVHDLLQRSPMVRKSSRSKFIKLSHELYQYLIEPLEKSLVNKKRLIIISHDQTNYIPFEILLAKGEVKAFKELDFLVKEFAFSYHYSSHTFVQSRQRTNRIGSGVYVFAPVYDDQEGLALSGNAASIVSANQILRAFDEEGAYTPLPASEFEAIDIMQLFNQGYTKNSKLVLRKAASESDLKAGLKAPYQFIHIAGHSFADLVNPKLSGIACFYDQTNIEEDGILYAGEIYGLQPQADLITLSSCESGLGKLDYSDGLIGLNRAFVFAGIPNVVYSLWKVYDRVSSTFMVDFYESVLSGKNYATSLREAKLNLLQSEVTASPHYWSPYLLIGR